MKRWLRGLLFLLLAGLAVGLSMWGIELANRSDPSSATVPAPVLPAGDPVPKIPDSDRPGDALPSTDTGTGDRLTYAVLEGGQRVEGHFGTVHFEAWKDGPEGAQARYWIEGGEAAELKVAIESERQGQVDFADWTFDGRGILPDDRIASLETLAAGPMALAFARIPLDLACRPEAETVPAAVGAALLMPWQLLLKYAIDHPVDVAHSTALQADCAYFERRRPGSPLPVPYPQMVSLSHEERIPMAVPYFPLDGAGQRGSRP